VPVEKMMVELPQTQEEIRHLRDLPQQLVVAEVVIKTIVFLMDQEAAAEVAVAHQEVVPLHQQAEQEHPAKEVRVVHVVPVIHIHPVVEVVQEQMVQMVQVVNTDLEEMDYLVVLVGLQQLMLAVAAVVEGAILLDRQEPVVVAQAAKMVQEETVAAI
jgi:hypothetical protein